MIGLVVVCHEDMGTELVKAAEMIVGKIEAAATVSVKQESAPELLRDELQAAIKKVDRKKGVMLFTDMFGGTPSNIAFSLAQPDRIEVITGVNLPVLVRFLSLQHENLTGLREISMFLCQRVRQSICIYGLKEDNDK